MRSGLGEIGTNDGTLTGKYPVFLVEWFDGQVYNKYGGDKTVKHEVTTLNTKKTLAASLKKHMMKKPLSKITVSEIIADCGVNRKTFYYHFEDIYALLKWMLELEAIEVVKQFNLLVNPQEAISFVMDYVEANKHILNCAYDSMGRDELKRFFYQDFIELVRSILDRAEQELNVSVDEPFKIYLADFLTEALAGSLINYFKSKETNNREETLQNLLLICKVSIPNILLVKATAAATLSYQ